MAKSESKSSKSSRSRRENALEEAETGGATVVRSRKRAAGRSGREEKYARSPWSPSAARRFHFVSALTSVTSSKFIIAALALICLGALISNRVAFSLKSKLMQEIQNNIHGSVSKISDGLVQSRNSSGIESREFAVTSNLVSGVADQQHFATPLKNDVQLRLDDNSPGGGADASASDSAASFSQQSSFGFASAASSRPARDGIAPENRPEAALAQASLANSQQPLLLPPPELPSSKGDAASSGEIAGANVDIRRGGSEVEPVRDTGEAEASTASGNQFSISRELAALGIGNGSSQTSEEDAGGGDGEEVSGADARAEKDSDLKAERDEKALSEVEESGKRKRSAFKGVMVGNDGVEGPFNLTRISFMLYRVMRQYNLYSLVDCPCSTTLSWMPQLVSRLDMEMPGFIYTCVLLNASDLSHVRERFHRFFEPEVVIDTMTEDIDRNRKFPSGDLLFTWNAMQNMDMRISWKLIKLSRKRSKYLMLSSNPGYNNLRIVLTGKNIATGYLNVRKQPIMLSEPDKVIGNLSFGLKYKQMLLLYNTQKMRRTLGRW